MWPIPPEIILSQTNNKTACFVSFPLYRLIIVILVFITRQDETDKNMDVVATLINLSLSLWGMAMLWNVFLGSNVLFIRLLGKLACPCSVALCTSYLFTHYSHTHIQILEMPIGDQCFPQITDKRSDTFEESAGTQLTQLFVSKYVYKVWDDILIVILLLPAQYTLRGTLIWFLFLIEWPPTISPCSLVY